MTARELTNDRRAPRRGVLRRAFTLVEILIVVVILGILAAIVIPQFTKASQDAMHTATYDDLQKLRRHIGIYQARNGGRLPNVTAGIGTWGEIVGQDSEYLKWAPTNQWVGGTNSMVIEFGTTADAGWNNTRGWIYDPATGHVFASSFDANDQPISRP